MDVFSAWSLIRFSYFHELFGRLKLGPNDIISVFRKDGTVIMRTPFDLDIIGKNLGDLPTVKRVMSEPSGSYTGISYSTHRPRLYVWRDSTRPLVVLVGKQWSDIYELWRMEMTRIGALMSALILFVLGVTLFLAREIGRRAAAEDKLEELATTDALTGLRNRRKFDAVIDAEWRRAARQRKPVALLMIDADYFKTYNDTFGHQAGDELLVGIAICISDSVQRAGDCVARYGGEEFAVLLPGLSPAEALGVAETIRLKVEQWCGESAITTVSVGVASLVPGGSADWNRLVKAADKALYAAKASGRNRCVLAGASNLSLVA
jgi:diguanylate cyclase (GGDEF)-like protein